MVYYKVTLLLDFPELYLSPVVIMYMELELSIPVLPHSLILSLPATPLGIPRLTTLEYTSNRKSDVKPNEKFTRRAKEVI